jgi:hypothetical protein
MKKKSTKIITEKIVTKISPEEFQEFCRINFGKYSDSDVDVQIKYSCGMLDEIIITETLERSENV